MVATREILEAIRGNCGASDASVQVGTDAYEDLRNATPEQLLDAALWFYRQSSMTLKDISIAISFLRLGWELAQPGGWERVAPMWLRESKKEQDAGE